jgi:uncharacterized Zn finger protein
MCKHVAAVLYGVGARLDEQPELLFRLRAVDEKDLLANLDATVPLSATGPAAGKILQTDDISALFGLDIAEDADPSTVQTPPAPPKPARKRNTRAKPTERSQPAPLPAEPEPKPAAVRPTTAKVVLTPDGFVKWWK